MTGSNATNASALSVSDITILDSEPRIEDLRIANRLGFNRSRSIRELIERNQTELETYGSLAVRHGKSRGQAYSQYHLNEGQTLLVCMLARTPQAAAVRKEVIDVYMTYRQSGPIATRHDGNGATATGSALSFANETLEGSGWIFVEGAWVRFDGRMDLVESGDPVVVLMPSRSRRNYRLTVVAADFLMPTSMPFGSRTIALDGKLHPDTVAIADCIAIGRVIARTPIGPDGGAA